MEIGYFHCSKKYWINNRLDVNDFWELVAKGKREKVALWCVAIDDSCKGQKRPSSDEEQPKKIGKKSSIEEKRELTNEYELKLKEKHEDAYSRFQYKLWAEMLSTGVHTDLEEPPAAAMFSRENKRSKPSSIHENTAVMEGMVTVIDSLCHALTPTRSTCNDATSGDETIPVTLVEKAELRCTYMRQLNELRVLYDSNVLTEDEYEEQREVNETVDVVLTLITFLL